MNGNKSRVLLSAILLCLLIVSSFFVTVTSPVHANASASTQGLTATTQYAMKQYPLPSGSGGPWSIATDVGGNVWVAEQESNQIAMFNPSKDSFVEYNVPTANSTVNSVVADKQGNVWLTELTANRLGELRNGTSKIIEFKIPNATVPFAGLTQSLSCGPVDVVNGPNGTIWVLCLFSNQIDEFFPVNSTFDSFNLPSFQSGPAGIVFDQSGNFWFTAADVNMIGHGVISQLQNNTSRGITETAPLNSTYQFNFPHAIDFGASTENIKSSLPTPSGIGFSPDGKTLWITEHVDSSFDSYNIATQSIDRYWLSQTNDAYGFSVAFPNGLAVDNGGNVWIAEHYGNKVAQFNPATGKLNEYVVPCCGASSAGVYTLTLGKNGTVWFVEILGNAIGELEPVSNPGQEIAVNLPNAPVLVGSTSGASVTIPVSFQYSLNSSVETQVSLQISGVSGTGELSGASYQFASPSLDVSGSGGITDNLTISIQSLKQGTYYLTVSATPSSGDVIYSSVLKLVVGGGSSVHSQLIIYGAVGGVIAAILVMGVLTLARRKSSRRRTRPRRR